MVGKQMRRFLFIGGIRDGECLKVPPENEGEDEIEWHFYQPRHHWEVPEKPQKTQTDIDEFCSFEITKKLFASQVYNRKVLYDKTGIRNYVFIPQDSDINIVATLINGYKIGETE